MINHWKDDVGLNVDDLADDVVDTVHEMAGDMGCKDDVGLPVDNLVWPGMDVVDTIHEVTGDWLTD